MSKFNLLLKLLMIAVLILPLSSCKKPEGPGGKATIKGRVYATDYENTNNYVIGEGYSVDERVYIIYGKDNVVGNDVRTGPDGSFEFRYLNKGHYRVYANSLDVSKKYKGNDSYTPVIIEVDITGTAQTKDIGDIKINK